MHLRRLGNHLHVVVSDDGIGLKASGDAAQGARLPTGVGIAGMGIPGRWYNWGDYFDRFNIGKEPNEANRFGWIVEINAFEPTSVPVKRTALGRFKHEGAAGILNKDGRYVIYSGDDQRFDYIYRFVTARRFEPANPAGNVDLLDSGTLFVARFNADGSGDWLPLVHVRWIEWRNQPRVSDSAPAAACVPR